MSGWDRPPPLQVRPSPYTEWKCLCRRPVKPNNVQDPASKKSNCPGFSKRALQAIDHSSGELDQDTGYCSDLRAMLCILVAPGSPRSQSIVEEHIIAPNMVAVELLPNIKEVGSPRVDVCDSRATSPFSLRDATRHSPDRSQWLERHMDIVNDIGDVQIRSPAWQDDAIGKKPEHWSHLFPSLGSRGDDLKPHGGTQSPSALPNESPSIYGESQSFVSEYSNGLTIAVAPDLGNAVKGESFESNDPTLGLVHPIPRPPSLYIASRNIALFPDPPMEFEPLFEPPAISQECMIDYGVIPRSDWPVDDSETAPLANESSSGRPVDSFVNSSFTSMDHTCSPDSSPWSPCGYQANFGTQHQAISHNETFRSSGPELFDVNDQYNLNSELDKSPTAANDCHGLTLLSSDSDPYIQPAVHMNSRRSSFVNIAPNPGTVVINGDHDPFFVAADTFARRDSRRRINQPTQKRHTTDTSHLRQQLGSNRTYSCPSEKRNAFLIESKRHGLSYKDIKRLGGFKEAESTLRGRFRTLTKTKDQRVRKPRWHDKDVSSCLGFRLLFFA